MKKLFYTYSLLLLSFLVLGNCKSQPIVPSAKSEYVKGAVVDSVSYEIVKDSVYCNALNDSYHFEFLNVKHPNKTVEININKFLINLDSETRELNLNSLDNRPYLIKLKEVISNNCSSEADVSGWELIDTDYNVTLNDIKLLGVEFRWLVPGYAHDNWEKFTFDLNTGKQFTAEHIFNENINDILNDLSIFLLNEIQSDLESILEDDYYSEDDKKSYKQIYNNYIEEKKYQLTDIPYPYIIKEGDSLGIIFPLKYKMMAGYNHGSYIPIYYSFEKLRSYLTENFKKRVGL